MSKKKNITSAPHTEAGFRGYTMAELRYQRALIALKKEYCKENILETAEKIHKTTPFSTDGQRGLAKQIGGVAGKIIGGLNYLDYLMIGFSAYTTVRKALHFFKKK